MNERGKKGISPVVATILLVAMVVIIGLIIFLWLRGLVGDYGEKFEKNVELVCGDVNFDASYSSGFIQITNDGNVPIYRFDIKFIGDGSHYTRGLETLVLDWPLNGLSQGGVFSKALDVSSSEQIILIPVLLGLSDDGSKKAFTCEENDGYEIILN